MTQLVIVGAGRAGAHAALQARKTGFGGGIVLLGDEPYLPYDRPPLSKEVLHAPLCPELEIFEASDYREQGIDVRPAMPVEGIDRAAKTVVCRDGHTLAYDKLILATGCRARTLPGRPAGDDVVLYLRTLADALVLRDRLKDTRRLAIIGGGYVGLEVASTAVSRGCEVTVIEASSSIMNRVMAPEVAEILVDIHRRKGVAVKLGSRPVAIQRRGSESLIKLDDGEELTADCVVAGIGAEPADDLARDAGLEVADGIVVDGFGRTSDPAIVAVGDVARCPMGEPKRYLRLESWQHAERHARSVVAALLGGGECYDDVPWFWSQQHDVHLQMVGASAEWDGVVFRGDVAANAFTAIYMRDGRIVAANAFNRPRDVTPLRRLIRKRSRVSEQALRDAASDLGKICEDR